jgi:hypothetical protein
VTEVEKLMTATKHGFHVLMQGIGEERFHSISVKDTLMNFYFFTTDSIDVNGSLFSYYNSIFQLLFENISTLESKISDNVCDISPSAIIQCFHLFRTKKTECRTT